MTEPLKRFEQIIEIDCVVDQVERQKYIDGAIARSLPVVKERPRHSGKVAIVGSGPSVTDYVDTLKSFDGEIWGINRSFEWMRHRGIEPTGFLGIDPEWFLKESFIGEPPQDVTYYLAAQVHPCVFDFLADRNVQLWFMADSQVKLPADAYLIYGGTTCLSRAPNLAFALGFRDVHVFGGDSSFTNKTHVHGGDLPSNTIGAEVNGRQFKTTRAMMSQAVEFTEQMVEWARMDDPLSVTLYGDGLMQELYSHTLNAGSYEAYLRECAKERRSHLNRAQRRAMKRKAA